MRMIDAFRLSFLMRNRGKLRQSVSFMCNLLPPAQREIVAAQLADRVPSGPAISHAQLKIDTAFALVWRRKFAESSGPLYLWCDSSPQMGADWLLSICDMVTVDQLGEAAYKTFLKNYIYIYI